MTDKPVHERIAEDRAHYITHPDQDEWEEVPPPSETTERRPAGTMISVRLTAAEADEIRAAADAENESVSGFMRKVVLDRIHVSRMSVAMVTVALGNSSRAVSHVDLEPGVPVSGGVQSRLSVSCL